MKMFSRSSPCIFLTLFVLSVLPAKAEGTIDVFNESGLYAGVPAGSRPTDFLLWCGPGGCDFDLPYPSPGAPEGGTSLRYRASNTWGGFGFFFVQSNTLNVVSQDCSEFQDGHLRFWLKSNSSLTVEIEWATSTGAARKGSVTVPSTGNVWARYVIPLASFGSPDFTRIRGLFLITATALAGVKAWEIDHVRWTRRVARLQIFPSTVVMNPGQQRTFTVQGWDTNGEPVHIYATFEASGGLGTVVPDTTMPSVTALLSANYLAPNGAGSFLTHAGTTGLSLTATGQMLVTHSAGTVDGITLTASANLTVVTTNLDSSLGLFSELVPPPPGVIELLTFSGLAEDPPFLTADLTEFVEGTNSLRMTVNHMTTNAYSGYTFHEGLPDSEEGFFENLSKYYDGAITFWFKGHPQLQGLLTIGIRSSNIPPGTEQSKVALMDYVECDDQWHRVAIPCRLFSGQRPMADLARVREYFIITVVGDTGGLASFWIDDLRWETLTTRFNRFEHLGNQVFRMAVTNSPGARTIVSHTPSLEHPITWTPIHTNLTPFTSFELLHTNAASNQRNFLRVHSE